MTLRERVEALPIRPIGDISHGANPSRKIHLLPNAGTERNVQSSEYLPALAVGQSSVGQCSSFLVFFKLFFHVAIKGPSNNLFARHPGNALLTRLATRPTWRRMCSSNPPACLNSGSRPQGSSMLTCTQFYGNWSAKVSNILRERANYSASLNANDSAQSSRKRQHKWHD
jgi:hypothetical protein